MRLNEAVSHEAHIPLRTVRWIFSEDCIEVRPQMQRYLPAYQRVLEGVNEVLNDDATRVTAHCSAPLVSCVEGFRSARIPYLTEVVAH